MTVILYTEYYKIKNIIKNEFDSNNNKYNIEFELNAGSIFTGDWGHSSIFTFTWDGDRFDLYIKSKSDDAPKNRFKKYNLSIYWYCDEDKTKSSIFYVINNLFVASKIYENNIIDTHCRAAISNKLQFNSFIEELYQYINNHKTVPFAINIIVATHPHEQNQFNLLLE